MERNYSKFIEYGAVFAFFFILLYGLWGKPLTVLPTGKNVSAVSTFLVKGVPPPTTFLAPFVPTISSSTPVSCFMSKPTTSSFRIPYPLVGSWVHSFQDTAIDGTTFKLQLPPSIDMGVDVFAECPEPYGIRRYSFTDNRFSPNSDLNATLLIYDLQSQRYNMKSAFGPSSTYDVITDKWYQRMDNDGFNLQVCTPSVAGTTLNGSPIYYYSEGDGISFINKYIIVQRDQNHPVLFEFMVSGSDTPIDSNDAANMPAFSNDFENIIGTLIFTPAASSTQSQ